MRTALRIRPGHRSDDRSVLRINAAGRPGVSVLSPRELRRLREMAVRYRVAVEKGRVVGYLLVLPAAAEYDGEEFRWFRARHGSGFAYVDQVAVAPRWRGRRVGSLLYDELEVWARTAGVPRLACEVNLRPANPGSVRFHDRRGFAEVETLDTGDGRRVSLRVREVGNGGGSAGGGG